MKSLKYNLSLLLANALFALNFSLFVSIMESKSLSVEAIYLLESFVLLALTTLLRVTLRYYGERSPKMNLRESITIVLISIVSSLGWNFATLWGISLTSPIDAATIAAVGPSLTLLFAHFMRRRTLTGVRIAGVTISLIGVAVLLLSHFSSITALNRRWGNIIVLGATTIAAINTLIFKPYLERYGVIRIGHIYAIAATAVNIPLFGRSLLELSHLSISWGTGFEIALLLLIGCSLPLMLLFEGTEYLSPLHTSLYRYTQPIITSMVVIARNQATLSGGNYIAIGVIIVGGILVAQGVDRLE